MGIGYYLLLGLGWIATCIILGLYIIGKGISGRRHFTIGLKAILVSYVLALCFLFYIVITS